MSSTESIELTEAQTRYVISALYLAGLAGVIPMDEAWNITGICMAAHPNTVDTIDRVRSTVSDKLNGE